MCICFVGEIPSSLFGIPSLTYINFEVNNLHGVLPQEMCHQLPLLEVFSLVENQFGGSIPKSISNCTSLKELYLGENSFTGIYPHSFTSLSFPFALLTWFKYANQREKTQV